MNKKAIIITYWIVTIVFAAFMLYSGISELMHTESANKILTDLGYPLYLNDILGIAKVLGVIALVQTRFLTIKEWAYAGFTIDICGAMMSFLLIGWGIMPVITTLPFLIVLAASYYLWKKTGKN
jgi:hypothetical protein